MTTRYRSKTVNNVDVFYREEGDIDAPVLLLLHGFPTSSHQFRNLIPELADSYRIIAPDLPGFGNTVAPSRGEFDYSFENLAKTIDAFTEALELKRFALYVFDYGAPVGFRIASRHPERVTAIISQNGNAYEDGLTDAWLPIKAYWENGSQENRDALRRFLSRDVTAWQYAEGTPAERKEFIAPEAVEHDQAILDRDQEIQLDLFGDYKTNVAAYPAWQSYLRNHKPPLLALWGRNDPFFGPAGAEAFRRDVPHAEIAFVDGGHFPLETHGAEMARTIHAFLDGLGL